MGITAGVNHLARDIAHTALTAALRAANIIGAKDDFLAAAGVPSPVPTVAGSIGTVGRELFLAPDLGISADLLSIFTYGDVIDRAPFCSSYFDPSGPWYNVFYGGYGIRSHKPDGLAWGYDASGRPDFDEFLEVPRVDYNDLTAGALGCPLDKRCFHVDELVRTGKRGRWDFAEVVATIPSGLHDASRNVERGGDSLRLEYAVFGRPDASLLGARTEYEPVRMRGNMFFRQVSERVTFAWGGLCPDTEDGRGLLRSIIAAMTPLYIPPIQIGDPHAAPD